LKKTRDFQRLLEVARFFLDMVLLLKKVANHILNKDQATIIRARYAWMNKRRFGTLTRRIFI